MGEKADKENIAKKYMEAVRRRKVGLRPDQILYSKGTLINFENSTGYGRRAKSSLVRREAKDYQELLKLSRSVDVKLISHIVLHCILYFLSHSTWIRDNRERVGRENAVLSLGLDAIKR